VIRGSRCDRHEEPSTPTRAAHRPPTNVDRDRNGRSRIRPVLTPSGRSPLSAFRCQKTAHRQMELRCVTALPGRHPAGGPMTRSGCMTLSPFQAPHARARRARDPGSCSRCVRPRALNLCIEADVAAGTTGNPRPECQFAGAARASGACHWSVEKRPNNRSEEPKIEQKRREHPKTVKHARGMFGIEPDKHGGQDNHQEPSEPASNV
jgi:hypothetical protein